MERYKKGISAYKAAQQKTSSVPPLNSGSGREKPAASRISQGPPVEGFVKSTHTPSGYKKAAKFLLLVGKEEAAKVLNHLSEEEIEGITREIAVIKRIDHEEARNILMDFGFIKETGPTLKGGVDTVRTMLTEAFGPEKAETFIKRVGPFKGTLKPFAFLHDLDFAQIMMLFKDEPDTVIGIILPHLEPSLASKILKTLSADMQKKIIRRIAVMAKIESSVLLRVEEALKEKVRKQGKIVTNEIDGRKTLADILKHMNFEEEEKILRGLSEDSPDLYQEMKERLFTIDIIFYLEEKDFQKVLRDYDDTQIALLLKDKSELVRTHMLKHVSQRRRDLIMDEYEHAGAVKKRDVHAATKDFIARLTSLAEEGKIVIKREREIYI
ncbi:MAG: flagellar motor switch protein FliG [Spirochaetales bacterium]|nr:MAG: flagellar motor switch protein FliG [Spirochaetales bacterium]